MHVVYEITGYKYHASESGDATRIVGVFSYKANIVGSTHVGTFYVVPRVIISDRDPLSFVSQAYNDMRVRLSYALRCAC
jgi:hypothetical protein